MLKLKGMKSEKRKTILEGKKKGEKEKERSL